MQCTWPSVHIKHLIMRTEITDGTCRTAKAYLIPSRPPWRTSHWSSLSSLSKTSTVIETPVSLMWRRATPRVWAQVSLTGATTWTEGSHGFDFHLMALLLQTRSLIFHFCCTLTFYNLKLHMHNMGHNSAVQYDINMNYMKANEIQFFIYTFIYIFQKLMCS